MQDEVAVLAVDRKEVTRAHQPVDDLQLLACRVAAHVHIRQSVVDDLRARLVEHVDVLEDELLVTRDRVG